MIPLLLSRQASRSGRELRLRDGASKLR